MNKKNILITGGSRGLGLEYANYLATKGYNIGITDISERACTIYGESDSISSILSRLKQNNVQAWFWPADLTDPQETHTMVKEFISNFGTIHGLVANAGGDIAGTGEDAEGGKAEHNSLLIDDLEHHNIFDRNYYTCFNTMKHVIPYMQQQGHGKIITVSSVNAVFGVKKETAYSVAKAGVLQLTRSAAKEFREDGININCIMPGPVTTGRFLSTLKARNKHDLQNLTSTSRLNRVAGPADISPVVEFLLSEASDFISGELIRVDGGLFPQPM
jgi:NAD(P)-dependent dehydrogenase (short-subunit alcohol dehydrogenase family)